MMVKARLDESWATADPAHESIGRGSQVIVVEVTWSRDPITFRAIGSATVVDEWGRFQLVDVARIRVIDATATD